MLELKRESKNLETQTTKEITNLGNFLRRYDNHIPTHLPYSSLKSDG